MAKNSKLSQLANKVIDAQFQKGTQRMQKERALLKTFSAPISEPPLAA